MRKREILFVGCLDEKNSFAEGFSYAVDLAGMMNENIVALFVRKRKPGRPAGGGDGAPCGPEAVDGPELRGDGKYAGLRKDCRKAGIGLDAFMWDIGSALQMQEFIVARPGIDVVLLSPGITSGRRFTSGELNRFLKAASRPVVTISRQPRGAGRRKKTLAGWAEKEKKREKK
ncbi:MAG: hypothetical protein M0Z59_04055 [Nitrospiraceae bacterium]|nr:hypothetical protein [Nitrospiraceae bacterium]